MNLTATEATAPGYVTAWPSGTTQPLVSSLNLERVDETLPNLVIVPVGSNGRVSLFTQSGTHLIADLLGWFPQTGALHTVQPTRILETRPGPTQTGYTGPKPAAGSTVRLQVSGRGGLPSTGVAVAILNLTVTQADAPGFITVWPSGLPQPLSSSVNVSQAGQTIQNLVVAPLGADGAINLFNFGGGHLIADLVGWLPPNSGYTPTSTDHSPRITDTRFTHPVAAGSSAEVAGPSAGIQLVNVVSAQAPAPGYITVYPKGATVPSASNLNVEFANETIANAALVTSDSAGRFEIFTQSGTNLIVDSVGVFAAPG